MRLDEPATEAAAAFIADDLTQTTGDELAMFVEATHPAIQVHLIDDDLRGDPLQLRRRIGEIVAGAGGRCVDARTS
jgi:hypothetical protein